MACEKATENDYKLVDRDSVLLEAICEIKQKIAERNTLLAVDCEGDSLSRKGALTVITVATEEKVYIFDVQNWVKSFSAVDLAKSSRTAHERS